MYSRPVWDPQECNGIADQASAPIFGCTFGPETEPLRHQIRRPGGHLGAKFALLRQLLSRRPRDVGRHLSRRSGRGDQRGLVEAKFEAIRWRLSRWRAQFVPKWRAIQNKITNSYIIEIACDFAKSVGSAAIGTDFGLTRRRRQPSSHTTACALITLGVLSSGAVEALTPKIFPYALDRGPGNALEEMHSRNKRMIATSVGRRGKWRTLWRGVTTRPGRP